MDRQTALLTALTMLAVASLVVGASGWTLFVRERRTARPIPVAGEAEGHPEAHEDL
jgi:type II secretory pathway component PulK